MGRGRWLDLGHRGAFGRGVLVFGDGGHRGVWVCSIGCSASILCWDVNRAAWVYFMTKMALPPARGSARREIETFSVLGMDEGRLLACFGSCEMHASQSCGTTLALFVDVE
jgi:hypothetical protein